MDPYNCPHARAITPQLEQLLQKVPTIPDVTYLRENSSLLVDEEIDHRLSASVRTSIGSLEESERRLKDIHPEVERVLRLLNEREDTLDASLLNDESPPSREKDLHDNPICETTSIFETLLGVIAYASRSEHKSTENPTMLAPTYDIRAGEVLRDALLLYHHLRGRTITPDLPGASSSDAERDPDERLNAYLWYLFLLRFWNERSIVKPQARDRFQAYTLLFKDHGLESTSRIFDGTTLNVREVLAAWRTCTAHLLHLLSRVSPGSFWEVIDQISSEAIMLSEEHGYWEPPDFITWVGYRYDEEWDRKTRQLVSVAAQPLATLLLQTFYAIGFSEASRAALVQLLEAPQDDDDLEKYRRVGPLYVRGLSSGLVAAAQTTTLTHCAAEARHCVRPVQRWHRFKDVITRLTHIKQDIRLTYWTTPADLMSGRDTRVENEVPEAVRRFERKIDTIADVIREHQATLPVSPFDLDQVVATSSFTSL